jgi:hypothetical protein
MQLLLYIGLTELPSSKVEIAGMLHVGSWLLAILFLDDTAMYEAGCG